MILKHFFILLSFFILFLGVNNTIISPESSLVRSKRSQYETNCTFLIKDDLVYDLYDLYLEDNWEYAETHHELDKNGEMKSKSFYIGICHPVRGVSNCSSDSAVCFRTVIKDEDSGILSDKYINAGKPSPPRIMQDGMMELTYEGGDECIDGSGNKSSYSTKLYLHCPLTIDKAESGQGRPILLSMKFKCSFTFIWNTLSVCPKRIVSEKGCLIQLSNSQYPVNLHALHTSNYYNVSGFNSTFEFNICGSVKNGSCSDENVAVCDVSNPTYPKALAVTDSFSYSTNLTNGLLYHAENVDIKLYCDRKEFKPIVKYHPQFDNGGKNVTKHVFTIYSVIMCTPKDMDCVFEDENAQTYDLRYLHKKENNWEVIVTENGKQKLFFLNMCGPVNTKGTILGCPEGPVSVCETSILANSALNHGYITSHPVVNDDGSITILYTGGDPCKLGASTSSSRINLICSRTEHYPIFVEVTDSCEYIFKWLTPAACPQNVVEGNNCLVIDPLYGNVYDFNPLRKLTGDFKVNTGDTEFHINICGPLVNGCGDESNSTSICQVEAERKNGGMNPAKLIFNDGTIFMQFSNGSLECGTTTWESHILLLCSHKDVGDQGPQYLHADNNSCTHYFLWYTKHACPPHIDINCAVTDGNQLYDLSPLSTPKFNQIFITANNTKKFVLNVCRSVVHSKESRCSYDAGACLIDKTHENKTLSLGVVKNSPILERGLLKLRYVNGDVCNSTHKYETLIEFRCSTEEHLSYPILIGEENCLYLFEWPTIHACPQELSPNISNEATGNCTAVNTHTGFVFDMTPLYHSKPYELPLSAQRILLINICGKIKDPRCKDTEAGACVVGRNNWERSFSNAGFASKNLKYFLWNTYLEYFGGSKCASGFRRSTRISFVCAEDNAHLGPILIDDDQSACTYFINWYTDLACERLISCSAKDGDRTVDLSPLARTVGNYEIKHPGQSSVTYYINVCRALNPIIGMNCHPGSSACMVDDNKDEPRPPAFSLGHPFINPVMRNDDVSLMYSHGSSCPGRPKSRLSSKILFICNEDAGAGLPVFVERTHDCTIKFEWETSLVCGEDHSLDSGNQCQLRFEAAKANLDISGLYLPEGYTVQYMNNTFLINVCGSVCGHSGVCTTEKDSYGLSRWSSLKWEVGHVVLRYYSGSPCHGSLTGLKTSTIIFDCDMTAGYGHPVPSTLMTDSQCIAIFNWVTNMTCIEAIYQPKEPSKPKVTTTTTTTTPNSTDDGGSPAVDGNTASHSGGAIAATVIVLIVIVVALIYLFVRRGRFHGLINRVRLFSKKGERVLILDDSIYGDSMMN